MSDAITIALAVGQVLMDIIVALGMFILVGIRADLKSNTMAVNQLRTDVKDYIPRREFDVRMTAIEELIETRWQDTRAGTHALGNRVSELVALARWAEEDRRNKPKP